MFSSMKMEEYRKSELSSIFQVKIAAKNILGPWEPNADLPLQWDCSFWRYIKYSETDRQTLLLSLLFGILIYVKEKPFCQIEYSLLLVPCDPFHGITLQKCFMQMRVKRHFLQTASETIAPVDRVVVQEANKQRTKKQKQNYSI